MSTMHDTAAHVRGLEGVVSRRRDAPYVSGECKAWLKSKCATWKEDNKERWRSFEEAQLTDTTTGRRRESSSQAHHSTNDALIIGTPTLSLAATT